MDFQWGRISFRRGSRLRGSAKATKTDRPRLSRMDPVLADDDDRQERNRLRDREPVYVFPGPRGFRSQKRNFNRTWERIRRRTARRAPNVRPLAFHCARHTFLPWALASGISAKTVADRVGPIGADHREAFRPPDGSDAA